MLLPLRVSQHQSPELNLLYRAASLVTGLRDSFVRATARGGTWQGDLFRMNSRHARGRRRGRDAVGSPCSFSRLSPSNSRQSSTSNS